MFVKSLFLLFIIFPAEINGEYVQNDGKRHGPNPVNEVSAPFDFSRTLLTVLDGIILFLSSIIHAIDAGIDKVTDIAAMPQEIVFQLIVKAIYWLEKTGYHKITSIVGNVTVLEAAKNLILKTQNCLVDSSVDLPKYVAGKLLHCVTNPLEEAIKTIGYVVKDIKNGLEVLEVLTNVYRGCKNGVGCLRGVSAILENGTRLVKDIIKTAQHISKLLAIGGGEIPACFAERLSVTPVNKLRQSGVDFLVCCIGV